MTMLLAQATTQPVGFNVEGITALVVALTALIGGIAACLKLLPAVAEAIAKALAAQTQSEENSKRLDGLESRVHQTALQVQPAATAPATPPASSPVEWVPAVPPIDRPKG
jgi:hypothetical protein